jgi:outer membrane protein
MKSRIVLLSALAMTAVTSTVQATDAGDWIFRVGVHSVRPKSNNHDLVNVDAAEMLTFNATYMLAPNWGVEVLAALPFQHDINLNGGGKVGETKHLPPTASVQYHFLPDGKVRPYVGAGLNYTMFFKEKTHKVRSMALT